MSPQAKNLLVLAALTGVAGVLGAYAYFGVLKADEAEAERKEASDKLFSARSPGARMPDGGALPEAQLTRITVSAKGEVTVLEQKEGKWWITSPVQAPADESVVSGLAAQLNQAKVKAAVEEQPTEADLARYGLDKPRFSVEAKASIPDGQGGSEVKEVALQGGIENPFDGSVYLRKGSDPKVYSVDGYVRSALEKTTYELRDKQVIALEEPKLTRIEVKAKANGYLLERDEKKAWRLSKPGPLPAEGEAVSAMLSAIKGERALSFPSDSPEERKRLGLEAPAVDATFTSEGGETVRLRLSKATAAGQVEQAYALREDKSGALLAEVALGALAPLDKPAHELRDRTVLAFAQEQVHRIAFTPPGGGQAIVVEKRPAPDAGGGEWAVTAPEAGPAKQWKLSSLLWTLASLKASGFGVEKPKDWTKLGVNDASRAVTLFDAQGKALAKLQVGKEVPGKAGTAYVRGSQDLALELDTARLSELPATVDDVLDRPSPAAADGGAPLAPAADGGAPLTPAAP